MEHRRILYSLGWRGDYDVSKLLNRLRWTASIFVNIAELVEGLGLEVFEGGRLKDVGVYGG